MTDPLTASAAKAWRDERDRADGGKPPPHDREAHARALWRTAQTPELRAHLRKVYPDLFAEPKPRPTVEPNIDVPQGFFEWTVAQQDAWLEAHNRYTEARRS